jgi:hypothetical protein
MRYLPALFASFVPVFCLALAGQTVPETTLAAQISETAATNSVKTAQDQLERIRSLVDAGALPKVRLEQAQRDLDDAQVEAVLDRTLYGKVTVQNLTEEMANEMVAAAQRRVDRQNERIADANKLVDDGLIARNSTQSLQDDLNQRQMALNLAHQRSDLFAELTAMARTERSLESIPDATTGVVHGMEHYVGAGWFNEAKDLKPIETAFARKFEKPLPISADGETAVHRALGFDHRGRVDVAVNPDQKEGQWLMSYLKSKKIPFYAFTHAIPGKATGAHIHIGPGSTRLQNAD